MTLLEMVQDILSAMDSDEVNSISDTTEAQQVATAIKHAYFDIMSRSNSSESFDLFELNPSGNISWPTVMFLPPNVMDLLWVKYDKRQDGDVDPSWNKVQYLPQDVFFDQVMTYRNQGQNDVVHFQIPGPNSSSIDYYALNNKAPDWYTSFNDNMIVFDSYDSGIDATLMKDKTVAYGELGKPFQMTDAFVPELDSRNFSLLYNEAKASCFADLKQVTNDRAEQKVKKGWVTLQNQDNKIPARPSFYDTTPNYGRKGYYGSFKRRGYYN